MKDFQLIITTIIILIVLTACRNTDPDPTATPVEDLPEATAVPTNLPPNPEILEPETYPAQVVSYNLGDSIIIQDHFPEDSRFREMPVRLNGVIGVPESDEAHPVVLILHGSHALCGGEDVWPCTEDVEQKNYEGFTYLVEALAEAGYVALAINVNAEHTFGFGEAPLSIRTTQLIDAHLGELVAANAGESDKFGVDLNGRADLSQMAWLGHSRGGDYANWIVRQQNLSESASPVGFGPVDGLVLVAPAIFTTDALPTVDLPFSALLSACDGDVSSLAGQAYFESARFDSARENWGTAVYLEGANHNNFNTILEPERSEPSPDRPDCTAEKSLSAEQQQEFLTRYTLDFLQTLYGQPEQADAALHRLGLVANAPITTTYDEFDVRLNILPESANQLTIIKPQDETELSQNLLGGESTLSGVDALFCPEGYYSPANEPGSEPCKRVNFNQPSYPQQFVVSWEESGAEWRTAVPEAYADITDYTAVQLRAALDPLSLLNEAGEPQSFTIELGDSSGNREQLLISPIAFPVGETVANDYFEGGTFTGHVYMDSFRIPLGELTAVDLTNITEIALIFDQTPNGSLFVADLEFLKHSAE